MIGRWGTVGGGGGGGGWRVDVLVGIGAVLGGETVRVVEAYLHFFQNIFKL